MSTTLIRSRPTPSANGDSIAPRPWSDAAPPAIRALSSWDEESEGWRAFLRWLEERGAPPPLKELLPGKASPLLWGLNDDLAAEVMPLLTRLGKGLKKPSHSSSQLNELAARWLAESAADPPAIGYACSALAWGYWIAELASRLDAATWWSMVDHLAHCAGDAAALSIKQHPLAQQLLAAELPLVLAQRLPEIAVCQQLQQPGMAALNQGLDELLSDKGLPAAAQLATWRPLLACWTRSLRIQTTTTDVLPQGRRFTNSLRAALSAMRRDGTQLLEARPANRRDLELFTAAAVAAGDAAVRQIAGALLDLPKPPGRKRQKSKQPLPLAGVQCDHAQAAVLRTCWTPKATAMLVRHDRPEIELEIHQAGTTLARGVWQLELVVDGRPCRVETPWSNICWVSDEDVDYLELEARLTDGVRVQRQMLLARQEKFLYLADALVRQAAGTIEYRSAWPLAETIGCQPADDTREVRFEHGKRSGLVFPLALPEWRRDPRGGSLEFADHALRLRQSREATSLYAPLWIDLDRSRRNKPLTWRQLTVAQDRRAVAADTAVGYRVQIGRQQWLIYRSLGPRANRTVLGSNLVSEFMLARFTDAGEVQPLLEIE